MRLDKLPDMSKNANVRISWVREEGDSSDEFIIDAFVQTTNEVMGRSLETLDFHDVFQVKEGENYVEYYEHLNTNDFVKSLSEADYDELSYAMLEALGDELDSYFDDYADDQDEWKMDRLDDYGKYEDEAYEEDVEDLDYDKLGD